MRNSTERAPGRRLVPALLTLALLPSLATGHEIPNARVDRSIQATVVPGHLSIDYEVSLSELTLTQDLRALFGELAGSDREDWFKTYGVETGPLNAKGLLVTVDGRSCPLRFKQYSIWTDEQHPRFTFRFVTEVPPAGRLTIQDTNFASSEGTSRLALRGESGAVIEGDPLPAEVDQIPIRPVWQLSDAEEKRTRQVTALYLIAPGDAGPLLTGLLPVPPAPPAVSSGRLTRLLVRESGWTLVVLVLAAFGLGAAHAVQPGHGKTLVAATVLGDRGSWRRGVLLALITTLTHTGSVLLIALALWWTRSTRFAEVHIVLERVAGFAIAAIGLWRLGRHLAGRGEHEGDVERARPLPRRGLIGLGVAGGLVPCWDAIGLIVLARAWGKLGLGLVLLLAFSLGMAVVLILVGVLAARFRRWLEEQQGESAWERRLGIASALMLTGIGLYLMELA